MKTLITYLTILFVLIVNNSLADPFRILNGKPSEEKVWPWIVSISQSATDPASTHRCGGTLISESFVLTAAHCVSDMIETPSNLQILIGRTKLRSEGGIIEQVKEIIVHPNYSEETNDFDIALIRLKRPVHEQQAAQLLTISEDNSIESGIILGWGVTDAEFLIRPNNLQEAEVPVMSASRCEDNLGLDFNPSTMICGGKLASAMFKLDGVDTCYGDSGGPLVVSTPGGWKIAGITSWGFSCGNERAWSVYTKVSIYTDWISKIIQSVSLKRAPIVKVNKNFLVCERARWSTNSIKRRSVIWEDKKHKIIGKGTKLFYEHKKPKVRCVETVETTNGLKSASSKYI